MATGWGLADSSDEDRLVAAPPSASAAVKSGRQFGRFASKLFRQRISQQTPLDAGARSAHDAPQNAAGLVSARRVKATICDCGRVCCGSVCGDGDMLRLRICDY